ncbi:MAG: hypothetical protein IJI10_05065 [Eubacterium sp.]|nr:hypothetical protein [Eubacterium sp.]
MGKRNRRWLMIGVFAVWMLLTALPVSAAGFKSVYTNTGWSADKRTSGGTVFSSSYQGSGHALFANRNNGSTLITNNFNGGTVISNGKTVYYCAKTSGKWCLYKADLNTGTSKKAGTLSKSAYNIDLAGIYKNQIYFIIDVPEGTFARINLKNKAVKKISFGRTVSRAEQAGKYFVLADGTGAGYSYLGIWNAGAGKFKVISKNPIRWVTTSKYVYYAEQRSGNILAQNGAKVRVRRYKLSNGKKKTLTKTFRATGISDMTRKYLKYTNAKGKQRTIRW